MAVVPIISRAAGENVDIFFFFPFLWSGKKYLK